MAESVSRRIVRRTTIVVAAFAVRVWPWFNPDGPLGRFPMEDDALIREQPTDDIREAVAPRYGENRALSQRRGQGTRRGLPFGYAVLRPKGALCDHLRARRAKAVSRPAEAQAPKAGR
ncbi:MAG: hypothetical protein EA355_07535 [Rhodobacteraceae bacterium]|nr:MAG: hypothetical protein EA355_07535 [Paracoccaceae bacterium]